MSAESPDQHANSAPEITPAPSAEEYKEIEQSIQEKREELATASTERMVEIVSEIKSLEQQKGEAYDAAYVEANAENTRVDEERVAEAMARTEGTRIQKIDEAIAIERSALAGATTEQLSEIVSRIRTLESEKTAKPEPNESEQKEGTDEWVPFSDVGMKLSSRTLEGGGKRPEDQAAVVDALEAAGFKKRDSLNSVEATATYAKLAREKAAELDNEVLDSVKSLEPAAQEQLAREYFQNTIGANISAVKEVYPMYLKLKGTPFGDKFKELESARLQAAGYGPFDL